MCLSQPWFLRQQCPDLCWCDAICTKVYHDLSPIPDIFANSNMFAPIASDWNTHVQQHCPKLLHAMGQNSHLKAFCLMFTGLPKSSLGMSSKPSLGWAMALIQVKSGLYVWHKNMSFWVAIRHKVSGGAIMQRKPHQVPKSAKEHR